MSYQLDPDEVLALKFAVATVIFFVAMILARYWGA